MHLLVLWIYYLWKQSDSILCLVFFPQLGIIIRYINDAIYAYMQKFINLFTSLNGILQYLSVNVYQIQTTSFPSVGSRSWPSADPWNFKWSQEILLVLEFDAWLSVLGLIPTISLEMFSFKNITAENSLYKQTTSLERKHLCCKCVTCAWGCVRGISFILKKFPYLPWIFHVLSNMWSCKLPTVEK